MRYAKLINNYPSYAPRRLRIGSSIVYNPTDAQLLSEGYLPVVETDAPEVDERHYPVASWEERDGEIVQVWTVEEIPITDEQALTRYANSITGANDPDLISAAETMITKLSKEES